MEPLQHQMMGYDRAITMFSPDGRLLQVEYAKKTVKKGSTAIGLICKEGVAFIVDKRVVDPFLRTESIEKIWMVDEHLGATASGIVSDARVLIERAQLVAQQHKITYETPIDVLSVVKDLSDINQSCTQSGGLRPFGVSLLIAGIEGDEPKLYEVDPAGIFFGYYAKVIGEADDGVEEILKKKYSYNSSLNDILKLGVRAIVKTIDHEFDVKRLDCAFISVKDKQFTRLTQDEVKKYYDEALKIKD